MSKKHIINNLKTVKRQLKKMVGKSWVNEIIWIEDAIRYINFSKEAGA